MILFLRMLIALPPPSPVRSLFFLDLLQQPFMRLKWITTRMNSRVITSKEVHHTVVEAGL